MKTQLIILTTLCFAVLISINAQETVVSSGGDASSTTGSASYSVG